MTIVKQVVRGLCPPALWDTIRSGYRQVRPVPPPPPPPLPVDPRKRVTTFEELDAELARALAALDVSCDASFAILDGFVYDPDDAPPADPYSREYRDWQMNFYRRLSGRTRYQAQVCEQAPLDEDKRQRPFPYYTRSCTVVGEQLMAVGFLIRAFGLPPGGRVAEFGAGFGMLTLELARTGFDVTAIEINPLYVELINQRAAREDLPLKVVCSGMLDYTAPERFDRVVFYESFHHCDDHEAMVARLDSLVRPGGSVVFAGEPVTDDFTMPWGVRRDGRSLWAIRLLGWLELGFRTDYFIDLLARYGWRTRVLAAADVPWQRLFVATRASESD